MEKQKSGFFQPKEIVAANMNTGKGKTEIPFGRLILLGTLAGMFIACGASASSVAMHAIGNVGLARLVGGAIFPVGLMMILFVGGELFTGDCLMIMGCMHRKYSILRMTRVLAIVFVSNFVGAVLLAALVSISGQYNYTNGLLGAYTIKVAVGKLNLSFLSAFSSGILCNIFVCAAVLMASAAKDIGGKVWAIFFPIMAFVVSGYEHCVANMYYIPAAIFASANETYFLTAMTEYGYTAAQLEAVNWSSFLTQNLIPVTLGNIIGGMLFVGIPLYLIHCRKIKADER